MRPKRRSSKWFETRDPRKWKVPSAALGWPFSLLTSSTIFNALRLFSIKLQQKSISLRALATTGFFLSTPPLFWPPPNGSQPCLMMGLYWIFVKDWFAKFNYHFVHKIFGAWKQSSLDQTVLRISSHIKTWNKKTNSYFSAPSFNTWGSGLVLLLH